jgi:GT2 family glycosyltransferase
VSDDSTDDETRLALEGHYFDVDYVVGPRVGLGANRNCAAARATGDLVLFLDDDCHLGDDFLATALACQNGDRTIVSGRERNAGHLIGPAAQSFLGFQERPYRPGEPLSTIVINATLFPRSVFEHVCFDDRLVYGYDEVDVTTRAIRAGFAVTLCPDAVNHHFPAPANRELYSHFVDASRIYVTYKRYRYTDGRPGKAAAFLATACAHLLASRLRHSGVGGVARGVAGIRQAWHYISADRRDRGSAGPEPSR